MLELQHKENVLKYALQKVIISYEKLSMIFGNDSHTRNVFKNRKYFYFAEETSWLYGRSNLNKVICIEQIVYFLKFNLII